MKHFYSTLQRLFIVCLLMATITTARAEWEIIFSLPTCYSFHIDKKTGTFLASDFRDACDGGIYYSDDQGNSWSKSKVADHNYNKFVETDKYIFALGYGGRIARSEDGGHNWELLSYRRTMEGYIDDESIENTAAYGLIQVGERIYVVDYAGGVIYSEDYGETWTHTADDIFVEEVESKKGTEKVHEALYGIETIGDRILVIGLYKVYSYNAKYDKWVVVRSDSNLMSISCHHKDKLYSGRAMPNDEYRTRFLEVTSDGKKWTSSGRPDIDDNNVRAIGSNDYLLVVGMQSTGIYFSEDDGLSWDAIDLDHLPKRYPKVDEEEMNKQKLTVISIDFDDKYLYAAFYDDEGRGSAPGVYRYAINDLPLAIQTVLAEKRNSIEGTYNLQGQKVSKANRGIYIKDGKKVLY